MRADIFWPLAC